MSEQIFQEKKLVRQKVDAKYPEGTLKVSFTNYNSIRVQEIFKNPIRFVVQTGMDYAVVIAKINKDYSLTFDDITDIFAKLKLTLQRELEPLGLKIICSHSAFVPENDRNEMEFLTHIFGAKCTGHTGGEIIL